MRAVSSKTTRARHKKILEKAKSYRGKRSNVFSQAKNAVMRAGRHAYSGRKLKKRDFRGLWITRINAVCRTENVKYSRLIDSLTKSKVKLNRKVMAELALNYEPVFKELLKTVR